MQSPSIGDNSGANEAGHGRNADKNLPFREETTSINKTLLADLSEVVTTLMNNMPQFVQGSSPAEVEKQAGGGKEARRGTHPVLGVKPERGSTSADEIHLTPCRDETYSRTQGGVLDPGNPRLMSWGHSL